MTLSMLCYRERFTSQSVLSRSPYNPKESHLARSMKKLTVALYDKLTKQVGQGLVEYVLLTSLIAISLISSLMLLKDNILNVLSAIPHLGGGN